MELWIRSKDKTILQKVNRLYVCKYAEEKGYGIYDLLYNDLDDCDVPLGFYKTRERALEVLDEIQSILDFNDIRGIVVNANRINSYVYEMPKE